MSRTTSYPHKWFPSSGIRRVNLISYFQLKKQGEGFVPIHSPQRKQPNRSLTSNIETRDNIHLLISPCHWAIQYLPISQWICKFYILKASLPGNTCSATCFIMNKWHSNILPTNNAHNGSQHIEMPFALLCLAFFWSSLTKFNMRFSSVYFSKNAINHQKLEQRNETSLSSSLKQSIVYT